MMSHQSDSPPSASRKRSHDGELVKHASTPDHVQEHPASNNATPNSLRQLSPAMSTSSSTSALTALTQSSGKGPNLEGAEGSAQKRPKLTFAERQVEKAVKLREKAQKAEDKREKEESKEAAKRARELEKAQKDAEKAKTEATKAEKQKIKEAEKLKRDAAKAQREAKKIEEEEAKLKKERAQTRLGAFFQKPVQASTPPSLPEEFSSGLSSRRSSTTSIDIGAPDATFKHTRFIPAEFRKWFLPFFVEQNMALAPTNRFISGRHKQDLSDIHELLEAHHNMLDLEIPQILKKNLKQSHRRARKGKRFVPVKKLVEHIDGRQDAPIDLTGDNAADADVRLLEAVPMKVLSYSVDVRPPYQGTFTRPVSSKSARKISRRPHTRLLPDIDYDYDSEGEWEAPEDGDEDLNSEDEEGTIDNEDEEMDDFLDDTDDVAKRRLVVGDFEPISSGLCWQGDGSSVEASMKQYCIDVLDDACLPFPIDPFSMKYWAKLAKASPMKGEQEGPAATITTMQPPRLPLAAVSPNNALLNRQGGLVMASTLPPVKTQCETASLPVPMQQNPLTGPTKPLKLISPDLLPAFKQAVEGSDLTKAGLVETLKKQFPKVAKDVIKDTLSTVAQRCGMREVDKRWVLI